MDAVVIERKFAVYIFARQVRANYLHKLDADFKSIAKEFYKKIKTYLSHSPADPGVPSLNNPHSGPQYGARENQKAKSSHSQLARLAPCQHSQSSRSGKKLPDTQQANSLAVISGG